MGRPIPSMTSGRRTARAAPRAGRYLSGRPLMPSGAHISVPRVRLLLSAGYAKMIPAGKDVDACGAYDPDRIGR